MGRGPTLTEKGRRFVQRFEEAVRNDEMKGARPKAEFEPIHERYLKTRKDLYDYIKYLENRMTL